MVLRLFSTPVRRIRHRYCSRELELFQLKPFEPCGKIRFMGRTTQEPSGWVAPRHPVTVCFLEGGDS